MRSRTAPGLAAFPPGDGSRRRHDQLPAVAGRERGEREDVLYLTRSDALENLHKAVIDVEAVAGSQQRLALLLDADGGLFVLTEDEHVHLEHRFVDEPDRFLDQFFVDSYR